ncbi:MAG: hypothetical protein AB7E79_00025 [Rhodospirillaceae bacterium]
MTVRTAGFALASIVAASPVLAQDHAQHQQHDHAAAAAPMAMPAMSMTGALGPYSMNREASGTSWQPDASAPMAHTMSGDWMFMTHAILNGAYSTQGGPRGDDDLFVSGMIMGGAQRSFDGGALNFRAMLSPDPLMGRRGYPLLLAAGETADGVVPLVDRQHPHDLVMELASSVSVNVGEKGSVFLYGGLPGEPAFGPPAFMHRASIMDSPEAPISHHWLDSTHITFGVLTAGYVYDQWKLEVSRFRGREPDEKRYDIESPRLDSTAVRASWNPSRQLSLQVSWAELHEPEQLGHGDQKRWSASAIYTVQRGGGSSFSATAAWGRKVADGHTPDAWVLEGAYKPGRPWTIFARAEWIESDELFTGGGHHGPQVDVSKVSAGLVHAWPLSPRLTFALGGLVSVNWIPAPYGAAYGGRPIGAMVFARIEIN